MGLKFLGVVAAAVGTVLGWGYLEEQLTGYVRERASVAMPTAVNSGRVVLADAPAWLNDDLARGLAGVVAARVGVDPLDHQSLVNAERDLESVAWVAQVNRIQRLTDGAIVVHARYRQPIAVVQERAGDYVLDADAVVLSGPCQRGGAAELGLPVIVGAATNAAGVGQVWQGLDVTAGLALVTLLRGQPFMNEVRAVDVGGRDARGRVWLTLRTAGGQVRWGLAPGREQAIEPEAAVKLRSLASVYTQRRTIDLPGRIVDVRLSSDAVFIEPAANREGSAHQFTW